MPKNKSMVEAIIMNCVKGVFILLYFEETLTIGRRFIVNVGNREIRVSCCCTSLTIQISKIWFWVMVLDIYYVHQSHKGTFSFVTRQRFEGSCCSILASVDGVGLTCMEWCETEG